jgi:hypothetical protein
MELERDVLVSPTTEVPVVEEEVVLAIPALAASAASRLPAPSGWRGIRSGAICDSRAT